MVSSDVNTDLENSLGFVLCISIIMMSGCISQFEPSKLSKHPGVTLVEKPAMTETSDVKWFQYYLDQFDCYSGEVQSPNDNYPEAAKLGYHKAKLDWNEKLQVAKHKKDVQNILIAPVAAIVLMFVFLLPSLVTAGM